MLLIIVNLAVAEAVEAVEVVITNNNGYLLALVVEELVEPVEKKKLDLKLQILKKQIKQ